MSDERPTVEMPETSVLAGEFAKIMDAIELAKTGHQESIDFICWFTQQTVMASASMLGDPDMEAVMKRYVEQTAGVTIVDNREKES